MLLLLAQIAATLAVCWIAARLLRRIGQPAVIGEIIAGIALGPTLFGALAPSLQRQLFPASSMAALRLVAEGGVVLYMFCVGMRVDGAILRRHRYAAVIISLASIAVPMTLGLALAPTLYRGYAPHGTPFSAFALFIGVGLSITAFPVLARILADLDLLRTPIGSITIAGAAVDDLIAWLLLAVISVIAGAKRSSGAMMTIASTSLFTLITFGAFVVGAAMPRKHEALADRLETITLVLLPLFFAYSGLRTNITLLNDWRSIAICVVVIAVATLGKLGGGSIAARLMRQRWRDALAIGVLMNTRGLVELVAVNIAYDLGIITQPLFTIMVLMALVTTAATSPMLRLVYGESAGTLRSRAIATIAPP